MQKQKAAIRKSIIKIARHEFLEKGFRLASMRTVAEQSGVGLSNIYNYFKNKDDILKAVLEPVLKRFDEMFANHNQPENISMDVFESDTFLEGNVNMMVDLIADHRAELKLLLFNAHGSSLENYWDQFTERNTVSGLDYIKKMKQKYPRINTDISRFFIHTAGSWWLRTVGEIITHDELSRRDLKKFISEYMTYSTAGWKKLMQV